MTANEQPIVITGASTGIGKATALHLDKLGFRVLASVRKEADGRALEKEDNIGEKYIVAKHNLTFGEINTMICQVAGSKPRA